jgi:hypothetical protein
VVVDELAKLSVATDNPAIKSKSGEIIKIISKKLSSRTDVHDDERFESKEKV